MYSYQLTTDRIWREIDGEMRELPEPSAGLRACLRMAALRRYLDLPVSENLPGLAGTRTVEAALSQCAGDRLEYCQCRVSAGICGRTLRGMPGVSAGTPEPSQRGASGRPDFESSDRFRSPALGPPPGEIGVPEPIHWCDVETIPPRTVAVNGLPRIHVDAEFVDVNATAFGPRGGTRPIRASWVDPVAEHKLRIDCFRLRMRG